MEILSRLYKLVSNLADIYTGNYQSGNKEYNNIKAEIMDISNIPTIQDDKKALRNDLLNVYKDTHKSYKEAKMKLAHG